MNDVKIKSIIKEKYSDIAKNSSAESTSCCGSIDNQCCSDDNLVSFAQDYSSLEGYNKNADMSLGCGIPTETIEIKKGYTVLDLGSGAGNDVFVARSMVGEEGRVIGVDMTEIMIEKANENNAKLGYHNVEFRLGEIENLPVEDNSVDVVISNCVLNLVPNKEKAFKEILRVLKPGGEFSVSDIVLDKELEPELLEIANLYSGCISGATLKEKYMNIIKNSGFYNVEIKKSKIIPINENSMKLFVSDEQFSKLKNKSASVTSITVYGKKK